MSLKKEFYSHRTNLRSYLPYVKELSRQTGYFPLGKRFRILDETALKIFSFYFCTAFSIRRMIVLMELSWLLLLMASI